MSKTPQIKSQILPNKIDFFSQNKENISPSITNSQKINKNSAKNNQKNQKIKINIKNPLKKKIKFRFYSNFLSNSPKRKY